MDKLQGLRLIEETGVIAIIRVNSSGHLETAVEAIKAGGVKVIEVTMNTPGALEMISYATKNFGEEILFGAGSVLDPQTAKAAIQMGAKLVVSPTLNIETIKLCNRYGVISIPGCATPTEMLTAWESGADMIKLFPANNNGPALIKAFLAPLPQLKIVPVGGVNLDNTPEFIKNGARAVGVGSHLINQKLLNENKFDEITQRSKNFIEAVKSGRK